MIDTNISEGFTSAIDSKNSIKNSLTSLGVIIGENDTFSTYGTKITENLILKSEVDEGKEKIATAITNKGVETSASDSFEVMANNITEIVGGDGLDDSFVGEPPTILSITKATKIMPYFYYFNSISSFTNTIIERLYLKNVTSLNGYNFSLRRSTLSIKIKEVECPNLTKIDTNCFNYILTNDALTEKSFPNLERIGSNCFNGYVFSYNTINTPDKIFPKVKDISGTPGFNLNNLRTVCFPALETTNGVWELTNNSLNFPKYKANIDNIYSTSANYIEFCFNECPRMSMTVYKELFSLTEFLSRATKIILPCANYDNTETSGVTIGNGILYYGHFLTPKLKGNSTTVYFYGFRFLIFGFKEKDGVNYNNSQRLILPSVEGNSLMALIFQQGSEKYFENESDKVANEKYLIADLKSNDKCKKILNGLSSNGYLYLADLDYEAFMAVVPSDTDISIKDLQARTRKWSEYKELLVNQYGLDSIADWYD